MSKPKVIALYLPQYHPMPENDEWWGKGYTEWTNVVKAKPLFRGHEQPKIPADLGFYDLRLSESRVAQADLAKRAGISALCYYHYWFEGRELMERPLNEVIAEGVPDLSFCLAWANHDWYNKGWINSKKRIELMPKLLIKQTYGGVKDHTTHFYALLKVFKDPRYFKLHDRLVFMIYAADGVPDLEIFIKTWRELAEKENLPGFYFITHIDRPSFYNRTDEFLAKGLDAINISYLHKPFETWLAKLLKKHKLLNLWYQRWQRHVHFAPEVVQYKGAIEKMDDSLFEKKDIIPTIIPNWDHTPRSGRFGRVFQNSSPELFRVHVNRVLKRICNKKEEDQVIFLKSWNEWGEGNYLEPDLKFGCQYIDTLNECLDNFIS